MNVSKNFLNFDLCKFISLQFQALIELLLLSPAISQRSGRNPSTKKPKLLFGGFEPIGPGKGLRFPGGDVLILLLHILRIALIRKLMDYSFQANSFHIEVPS